MKHPRRTLRAALAVIATLAASACGDLATVAESPDRGSPSGVYQLVSINQLALPYTTMADGASSVRISSGQLVLDGAGSFQQVLAFAGPASQWQSPTQGTYAVDENRITFRVSTGSTFEGTLYIDGRLEYVVQGNYGPLVFLFRRSG